MKTKLIILTVAATALLYSCSSERDEEIRKDNTEVKINQKTKLNQKGNNFSENKENFSKVGDSIKPNSSLNSQGIIPPNKSTDPDDGSTEVVDPTKPDKPW
ncbi:hypothetical protein [Chryseobacterium viscerum]|uniref:Lipoprotein n=1 Tax=Chryseobacterium viscerum TaxID=1037377 RepID=A0A5N4BJ66_9FLAO|nr:hypothetical protein [Chryseobacterium viscerum]KAB1228492.1 hypothetical protein F8D52_22735 [Chryseobacterium viscerum]